MTSRKDNLSLFSEDLTSELRDILNLPTIAEQNNTEIQEIGRRIAQFVFLKESLKFNAKGGINDVKRTKWM